MNRRTFALTTAAFALNPSLRAADTKPLITAAEVGRIDRARILAAANKALAERPVTVTSAHSSRTQAGPHDYFSQSDYWWPDPKDPGGPYIRRDGLSNPDNFNDHRLALIRLSLLVPALAAAWLLTRDNKYAAAAVAHLQAWFVTPATKMNPNLQYAQAVLGVSPGRGTGIIDTLHLVEVSRAIRHLQTSPAFSKEAQHTVRAWFADYLTWMTTSKNGLDEKASTNNHGTCWVAQAAAFAALTGNEPVLAMCRQRFRDVLLPDQLAPDGSLPLELFRTKPYSYSLFDLDILALVCQLASKPGASTTDPDNLWHFAIDKTYAPEHGEKPAASIRPVSPAITYKKAVDFYAPFIADKSKWPYPKDVEYFDDLPNRQPSLLFAGLAYSDPNFIALWRTLPPDPKTAEIIRNFPIRQPLLWVTPI